MQIITIGYMTKGDATRRGKVSEETAIKEAFSKRLNELCDLARIPPKGKNRQTIVGKLFGVSQKAARKWLEGEGLPTLEKAIEIARHFQVHVDWLLTGREAEPEGAREPLALYTVDAKMQSRILAAFDWLNPDQQDRHLKEIEAQATANQYTVKTFGTRGTTAPDKRVESTYGAPPKGAPPDEVKPKRK